MEQNRNDNPNNRNPKDPQKPKNNLWVTLVITAAIVLLISGVYNMISDSQYTETSYSDFLTAFENHNLDDVLIRQRLDGSGRKIVCRLTDTSEGGTAAVFGAVFP